MKSKARSGSQKPDFDVKVFDKKVFFLFGWICNPAINRIINAYTLVLTDCKSARTGG